MNLEHVESPRYPVYAARRPVRAPLGSRIIRQTGHRQPSWLFLEGQCGWAKDKWDAVADADLAAKESPPVGRGCGILHPAGH